MHVTMVKKRLENGDDCRKCVQAEDVLRGRGVWERIDRIVWAVEGEPHSEGMQLGQRFGVAAAPFFVVRDAQGGEQVVESTIKLLRSLDARVPSTAVSEPSDAELPQLAEQLARCEPLEIVRFALERWGKSCAIAWSGAEDVVLIDLAAHTGLPFSVFCLDTGRLHPETYRCIEKVRKHYGIEIDMRGAQGAAAQAHARGLPRLADRSASRSEPGHARRGARAAAGPRFCRQERPAVEAQPAVALELGAGVAPDP
jgi:hypothetical protein